MERVVEKVMVKKHSVFNYLENIIKYFISKKTSNNKVSPNLLIKIGNNGRVTYANEQGLNIINYYSELFSNFKDSPLITFSLKSMRNQLPHVSNLSDGDNIFSITFVPYEGICLVYGSQRAKTTPYLKDLVESEEKFKNIYDHLADPVVIHDLEGNIIDINKKGLEILQFKTDEVKSMNIKSLYPISDQLYYSKFIDKLTKKGSLKSQLNIRRKDRTSFIADISTSLFSFNGKQMVLNTIRDITRLNQRHQKLTDKVKHLSMILGHFNEGILLEEIDKSIVYVNDQFCKIFDIKINIRDAIAMNHISYLYYNNPLIENKDRYFKRKESIRLRRMLHEHEKIVLSNNRDIERDYVPIYHRGVHCANLWKFTDVTVRRVLEKISSDQQLSYTTKN